MHDVSGITGAAPVFRDLVHYLHRDAPSPPPPVPGERCRQAVSVRPAVRAASPRMVPARHRRERSCARAGARCQRRASPRIRYPADDTVIALDRTCRPRTSASRSSPPRPRPACAGASTASAADLARGSWAACRGHPPRGRHRSMLDRLPTAASLSAVRLRGTARRREVVAPAAGQTRLMPPSLLVARSALSWPSSAHAAARKSPPAADGFVPRLVVKFRAHGETAHPAQRSADAGVTLRACYAPWRSVRKCSLRPKSRAESAPTPSPPASPGSRTCCTPSVRGACARSASPPIRSSSQQFYLQSSPAAIERRPRLGRHHGLARDRGRRPRHRLHAHADLAGRFAAGLRLRGATA